MCIWRPAVLTLNCQSVNFSQLIVFHACRIFGTKDVFLNLAGGIKIIDPAMDLSVAAALLSSLEDIPVAENICFCGEIGLSGEIRAVGRIEQRIQEAARLGFK